MRQRQLLAEQVLTEARAWAEELTEFEIKGPFDLYPAWERLENRYGIPVQTFWSLRYRKELKDVWASLHLMLRLAVDSERRLRGLRQDNQQAITAILEARSG